MEQIRYKWTDGSNKVFQRFARRDVFVAGAEQRGKLARVQRFDGLNNRHQRIPHEQA